MKKLGPSEDLGNMQVPLAIDLALVTSAKLDDMPILEKVLALAIEDVLKRFEKDSFKLYVRTGLIRPMTQEELLSILPRKIHMAQNDAASGQEGWLCKTAHVSPKNITEDPATVTCKLCLKALG